MRQGPTRFVVADVCTDQCVQPVASDHEDPKQETRRTTGVRVGAEHCLHDGVTQVTTRPEDASVVEA